METCQVSENLGQEVTQYHFYCILLGKASHGQPDSRGRKEIQCVDAEAACTYRNGKKCRQLYLQTMSHTKKGTAATQGEQWEYHCSTNSLTFKARVRFHYRHTHTQAQESNALCALR